MGWKVIEKDEVLELLRRDLGDNACKDAPDGLYEVPKKNIKKAVKQTVRWLLSDDLNKKLERNFKIGKKYHDYSILEKFLVKKLGLE